MASTSTQAGRAERIVVTTADGRRCGQGEIRDTPSETSVTLEFQFPARPKNVVQAEEEDSSNSASESTSSSAENSPSLSGSSLPTPPANPGDAVTVNPSASSNQDSDETNIDLSGDKAEAAQSIDSDSAADENRSLSTPESDPETQEPEEAKSDTSSEYAS